MTEKRFSLTDWHEVKDNGKIMTVDEVVGKLNKQQARIEMLEKGILDCLFENKSIGVFAEEMGLVE